MMKPGGRRWHRALDAVSRQMRAAETTPGSFPGPRPADYANATLVRLADWTETRYSQATIREDPGGVLRVLAHTDGSVVASYQPGTWLAATAYDANGWTSRAFSRWPQ